MDLSNYISENIFLPFSDILSGQSVYSKLQFLQKSQFWSKEDIRSFQNERLNILVCNAYENVPYYNRLFKELKLKPNDIRTFEDLEKLPILSKQVIKKEGIKAFTSSSISKRKIIRSSSSGSTGEPLFFLNTKDAYSMNIAANLRGWHGMGYRLGDKYIKLSQNPRKRIIKRIQDKMSRNLYLSTNPLVESNFEFILKEIERYKPVIIRCYPDPLLFLARYKQKHPEFSYKPLAINTTGNTLHSETRVEIETAFGCKIFDSYSCEGNSSVFECPTHSCYHSTEEYGISEVVNENFERITFGVGKLISTDLWNLAHPFLRYDTQDYVEIDFHQCECKRNLLRINKILGRDNEILFTDSGRRLIVHNFTGFFQLDDSQMKQSIDQFQVIKTKEGTILFRLVVNWNFDNTVRDYIIDYWRDELKSRIAIEIVEQIPLTASGKRRFIINES